MCSTWGTKGENRANTSSIDPTCQSFQGLSLRPERFRSWKCDPKRVNRWERADSPEARKHKLDYRCGYVPWNWFRDFQIWIPLLSSLFIKITSIHPETVTETQTGDKHHSEMKTQTKHAGRKREAERGQNNSLKTSAVEQKWKSRFEKKNWSI